MIDFDDFEWIEKDPEHKVIPDDFYDFLIENGCLDSWISNFEKTQKNLEEFFKTKFRDSFVSGFSYNSTPERNYWIDIHHLWENKCYGKELKTTRPEVVEMPIQEERPVGEDYLPDL